MLEKRAAVLELMNDAFDARRPFVRVGLDHPGLHDVALVGATYGLRRARSARSACSARCGWTTPKAVRTVRAASFELSRLVESAYEED